MAFVIYGPAYSTYVRSVRLALEEKGAPYELREVDMLGGKHKEPEHLVRQPFGNVPGFEHDGFSLYETDAILRYVDEVAPGPSLTPGDAKDRARMNQVMGVIDAYGYNAIIQKLFWQRTLTPMLGGQPDEAIVTESLPRVRLVLGELERIMGQGPWLAGAQISLADLLLAPIVTYLLTTRESAELMAERPGLGRWWQAISARPSVTKTAPSLG